MFVKLCEYLMKNDEDTTIFVCGQALISNSLVYSCYTFYQNKLVYSNNVYLVNRSLFCKYCSNWSRNKKD